MNIGISIPTLPKPTPAQIEAGNYKKAHVRIHGLDISIENPKGSVRSGQDRHGKRWSIVMKNHYGYIRGYVGADKDQVDVYIGPNPQSEKVFIVNQFIDGRFDEHKTFLGFDSAEEARDAYLSNYTKGWQGFGGIKEKSIDEFKEWLEEGDLKVAAKAMKGGWIGCDLDGTLAHYDGDIETIGAPIPAMLERVKGWLAEGKDVRIFTARASTEKARKQIEGWCLAHIGKVLPITNKKDPAMESLFDDRAVQVVKNEGTLVTGGINLVVAPLSKALLTESQVRKRAEDETIRENKKKPEAKERHKFKAAQWTHGNGHPRCLICGDEPTMSGYCNDSILSKAFSNVVSYFFGKAIRDLPLQPSHRNPMVRRHQKIGVAQPARRPAPMQRRQTPTEHQPDFVRYSVFGQEVDPGELDSLLMEKYAVSSKDILRTFSVSVGDVSVGELRIDLDTGVDSDREAVEVKGFLYAGGSRVGSFTRILKLSDGLVTHEALAIEDKALQGQGFGVAFMKQQLDGYRRLGISKVETWSDGEVGKYAWAMKGFDFADDDTRRRVVGAFAKYLRAKRPKDYITRVREVNGMQHAWEVALFEIGGQRLGKEFLLSNSARDYSAVFDTDSDSINSKIFEAYYSAATTRNEPRQQEISRRAV